MNRKNVVLGYFFVLIFLTVLEIFKEFKSWGMTWMSLMFYLATVLMFIFPILKLTDRAKNTSGYLPIFALVIINILTVYVLRHLYYYYSPSYFGPLLAMLLALWNVLSTPIGGLWPRYGGHVIPLASFMGMFGFIACYILGIGSKIRKIASILLAFFALAFQMLTIISIMKYHVLIFPPSPQFPPNGKFIISFASMLLAWELPMIEEVLHWKALKSSTKTLSVLLIVSFLAFVLYITQSPLRWHELTYILLMMPAFSILPVRSPKIKYATIVFPITFLLFLIICEGWNLYDWDIMIFGVLMTLLPSVLLLVLPPDTFTMFQVEDSGESEMDLSKLPPKKRLKVLRKEYSKISPSELPEEALPVYEELKSMIETANEKVRRKKERKEAVELLESIERELHKIIELKEEYQSTKNRIISTIKEMTGL